MKAAAKYPKALAAIAAMMDGAAPSSTLLPAGPFTLGPQILRAPPEVKRRTGAPEPKAIDDDGPTDAEHTEDLLGELVDMVFVSADDAVAGGEPEVHLVFKTEVLGGLHLKLKKMTDGMHATFVVEDAASRRAVIDHIDSLVLHLKERGFTIAAHTVQVAGAAP